MANRCSKCSGLLSVNEKKCWLCGEPTQQGEQTEDTPSVNQFVPLSIPNQERDANPNVNNVSKGKQKEVTLSANSVIPLCVPTKHTEWNTPLQNSVSSPPEPIKQKEGAPQFGSGFPSSVSNQQRDVAHPISSTLTTKKRVLSRVLFSTFLLLLLVKGVEAVWTNYQFSEKMHRLGSSRETAVMENSPKIQENTQQQSSMAEGSITYGGSNQSSPPNSIQYVECPVCGGSGACQVCQPSTKSALDVAQIRMVDAFLKDTGFSFSPHKGKCLECGGTGKSHKKNSMGYFEDCSACLGIGICSSTVYHLGWQGQGCDGTGLCYKCRGSGRITTEEASQDKAKEDFKQMQRNNAPPPQVPSYLPLSGSRQN